MNKFGIITLLLFWGLAVGCSKNSDNDSPDTVVIDKSANLLGTGDSAKDILSNADFDKLLIEIAFVEGFEPTQPAINNFLAYLTKHTFKEEIEVIFTPLDSPNEETLTLNEIADLEKENRTAYNNGKTLAIYIYFADAPSDGDDEDEDLVTLGAVYRNTSMVIHEITVRKLAQQSFFITNSDMETATLNHEFGHLFGLVDLGSDPVNDHEDPDAENHCNVEGCLMRSELQFGIRPNKEMVSSKSGSLKSACSLSGKSVLNMFQAQSSKSIPDPPPLDIECILDLRANGGR